MDAYSFLSESRAEAVSMLSADPFAEPSATETPAEPAAETPAAQDAPTDPPAPSNDEVEKNSTDPVDSDAGNQDTETNDKSDESVESAQSGVEPSSTNAEFDDLQRAYSAAQEELALAGQRIADTEARLAFLAHQLQAPKAVPFNQLSQEEQDEILAEAEADNVTVEQVMRDRRKDAERVHNARARDFEKAGNQLVSFIVQHPKRQAHGERVSQLLSSPTSPFAFADALKLVMPPDEFLRQSMAEVERCFQLAELEAKLAAVPAPQAAVKAQAQAQTAAQKSALKSATRGEATRSGATPPPSSKNTDQSEDPLAAIMALAAKNRALEGLMI